jgi:hypothetical protein
MIWPYGSTDIGGGLFTAVAASMKERDSFAKARADYNSALAVPEKDRIAKWAHDQARLRLQQLDK